MRGGAESDPPQHETEQPAVGDPALRREVWIVLTAALATPPLVVARYPFGSESGGRRGALSGTSAIVTFT